jgi:hypothetical protein
MKRKAKDAESVDENDAAGAKRNSLLTIVSLMMKLKKTGEIS